MPDHEKPPIDDALSRLLSFRGQHATGAMVDPISKLTTGDLDVAIDALRSRVTAEDRQAN